MKKAVSFLLSAAMLFILSISAAAQDYTFELTPDTPETSDAVVKYMPEQKIYHFVGKGDLVTEIPVYGGVYVYMTLGGYKSTSDGVTDNGINCVCRVNIGFLDENGETVILPGYDDVLIVPADGKFRRLSFGREDMYAGLPENVKMMHIDIHSENDTAYMRNLYMTSSDTAARDMSLDEWEIHEMDNINAQTSRADHWIMVGFVFAVALIMMIFAKAKKNIASKK